MGEAKYLPPSPTSFSRSTQRDQTPGRVESAPPAARAEGETRRPSDGIKTKKNFIAQNAVENILSVAKKPEKNLVDSRKGDKFSLDRAAWSRLRRGAEYLKKRADEIRRAQEEYDNYVKEMRQRGANAAAD
uniref:DUF5667 domain-containing protein n=1 Tax=Macrostomum lignano TaxID=282301 RepID=A0A1I8IZ30_9PLAT